MDKGKDRRGWERWAQSRKRAGVLGGFRTLISWEADSSFLWVPQNKSTVTTGFLWLLSQDTRL